MKQVGNEEPGLPPKMAKDFSEEEDWPGYFGAVTGKGPRETLVFALDQFEKEGRKEGVAVDIAAGEGRDSIELLKRRWSVTAMDNHPDAFDFLRRQVPEDAQARLNAIEVDFANMQIPSCDLVNASFALPFCEPQYFPQLWTEIVSAIRRGGRFAGQFFGKRDSWASIPNRTHHSLEEVQELLAGFEIEMMREEEKDDPPDVRNPKHWQLFHVVARKKKGDRDN